MFRMNKSIPQIFYLQNIKDYTAGSISTQFIPFLESLSKLVLEDPDMYEDIRIHTEIYSRFHLLKGGHFPLLKEKTLLALEKSISYFNEK